MNMEFKDHGIQDNREPVGIGYFARPVAYVLFAASLIGSAVYTAKEFGVFDKIKSHASENLRSLAKSLIEAQDGSD